MSGYKSIMVFKQDSGRRFIVIDRKRYREKFINLLHTDSFIRLDNDSTKSIERKTQRFIRKIKNNLAKQEYSRLYPTRYHVENFTALPNDINLKMVALSIIFLLDQIFLMLELHHINWLNKYLTKLLSPLTSSQYTVNSTK